MFDWESMLPEDVQFNYETKTEVVGWDTENHEEVRRNKRELIAGE